MLDPAEQWRDCRHEGAGLLVEAAEASFCKATVLETDGRPRSPIVLSAIVVLL